MGNLFEEVLLIRSAVPPRVLNLITFFSAITVCFQVAIKTVSWQSLLRLEPFSLKNTRSFTQSIDVLMTDSLNQNSARWNTLHHPPASTLRMRTAILLFPSVVSRTKEGLFVAATAAVTWLRTCVIYIYHPWKTVDTVLNQEKISNVSLLTLSHVCSLFSKPILLKTKNYFTSHLNEP